MASATFYQRGCQVDYTPSSAVAVGDIVVLNDMVCVADHAIVANAKGALATDGVYIFPKATGAIGQGAIVYWDATAGNITTTRTSNKRAGKAAEAAASGDATVKVSINKG